MDRQVAASTRHSSHSYILCNLFGIWKYQRSYYHRLDNKIRIGLECKLHYWIRDRENNTFCVKLYYNPAFDSYCAVCLTGTSPGNCYKEKKKKIVRKRSNHDCFLSNTWLCSSYADSLLFVQETKKLLIGGSLVKSQKQGWNFHSVWSALASWLHAAAVLLKFSSRVSGQKSCQGWHSHSV